MFFLKPKLRSEEILPPPPPDFEEEFKEKPKFFDEIIEPEDAETLPEVKEFSDLIEGLENKTKPKKEIAGSKKRELLAKKPKILKKEIKKGVSIKKAQIKKITTIKQAKEKKLQLKKIKTGKKPKSIGLPKEINLEHEDVNFELPKSLEELPKEDFELPEEFKEMDLHEDLEDLEFKELEKKTAEKPKEVIEAEEEIKSAIEKIKETEKPSFFKRLFSKKENAEEHFAQPAIDGIPAIQDSINKARGELEKFDLEAAKKDYIEVMRMYNNLKPEEQAKVYHDIRDLYFERKSAEELKV
ncbi:hypothetical protein HYY71_05315 [Candidatus Woesearchaeota archaeon]|nr:hypothetical protein [Candidatus Woesearchaeota archaeon]